MLAIIQLKIFIFHESDLSHPSHVKVKNAWKYSFLSPNMSEETT